MYRHRYFCLLLAASLGLGITASCSQAKDYPYKFVYVHGKPLENMEQVELIRKLAKTAREHGLNGLILDAFFDRITREPPYDYKNLREIVNICQENGIEFIPSVMGLGYNAPMLCNDKNLIEGLPVRDALFVVGKGRAGLQDDPAVEIVNGGFERAEGGAPAAFTLSGQPGAVISIDATVAKQGKSSLKVELSKEFAEESALATQEISVHPYRIYRLSCWVRTEGIKSSGDVFPMLIQGTDGRRLQYYIPPVKGTSDWTRAVVGFNSKNYDRVRISVGAPASDGGAFWIDGLTIREEGLVNVLRRQGTPLVVKGETSGTVYEEGRDFAPVYDPVMTLLYDHEPPSIKILPGSRIAEGERLRVSFYNNQPIYNGQTPACFSEPEVYEWWRRSVEFLHNYIHPKKYYLGVDELRMAGTCETCKKRGLSVVEMLGDCIRKQEEIIRSFEPEAEIFIWSDMFDPNHNANNRQGNYYYFADETFENSWKYIPKDVVIVCWYHEVRDASLKHFSGNGFRTLGSSSGDLNTARGWLKSLDATPRAVGIMYTTWSDDFSILPDFGDLVNRKIQ